MRKFGFLLVLLVLLAACGSDPTPFPADVPVTPTVTPPPTDVPPILMGLTAETARFIPAAELALLRQAAQVTVLETAFNPVDIGARFDLVAGFGDLPGGTRSPVTLNAMLIISPEAPPLNMQYGDLIRRGVDAPALVDALAVPGLAALADAPRTTPAELRTELANVGRPDGFGLVMAVDQMPGAEQLAAQLTAFNVRTRLVPMPGEDVPAALASGDIHLAMVRYTTPEERQAWIDLYGQEFTVDLYALPISVVAVLELTITYTPGGWPLPSRGGDSVQGEGN
ncbi:MAG: hypothetical protein OHK0046_00860 [Anaerolineae bacterium]